jgi:hypothetical protein
MRRKSSFQRPERDHGWPQGNVVSPNSREDPGSHSHTWELKRMFPDDASGWLWENTRGKHG